MPSVRTVYSSGACIFLIKYLYESIFLRHWSTCIHYHWDGYIVLFHTLCNMCHNLRLYPAFSISIFGAVLCVRFSSPFWSQRWGTSQPKLHVQFSSGSNGNKEVKYCYISMTLASLISEIRVLMSLHKRRWIHWISGFW